MVSQVSCSSSTAIQVNHQPLTEDEVDEFSILTKLFVTNVYLLNPDGKTLWKKEVPVEGDFPLEGSSRGTLSYNMEYLKHLILNSKNDCTVVHALRKQIITESQRLERLIASFSSPELNEEFKKSQNVRATLAFLEHYHVVKVASKNDLIETISAIYADISQTYPDPERKKSIGCCLVM